MEWAAGIGVAQQGAKGPWQLQLEYSLTSPIPTSWSQLLFFFFFFSLPFLPLPPSLSPSAASFAKLPFLPPFPRPFPLSPNHVKILLLESLKNDDRDSSDIVSVLARFDLNTFDFKTST